MVKIKNKKTGEVYEVIQVCFSGAVTLWYLANIKTGKLEEIRTGIILRNFTYPK